MKSLIIVLVSFLGVFSKGLSSIGNEVKIEETEMLDDGDSLFSQVFDRKKGKNKKVCNKWKNCCKKFKEEGKERGLVITGGDNPDRLDSSVLISHLGLCSSPNIPALPETMSGGKSVWFENSLMFCGGSDIFKGFDQLPAGTPWGATDTCRKVKPGDLTWDSDPQFNMKEKRSWFSLNDNDNGKEIVAAGGLDYDGNIWDSLEKYSEGTWEPMGITLDNPVYGHCAVHYTSGGDSFLMIIGGSDTFDTWWDPTSTVTLINLSAGTQTILDSGPLPGLWAPACTRHGEDIYISGGGITNDSGDNGEPTSGVYKYNIEDGEFKHVGELNNPRWGHTMGVTDKDQLVVAGGYNLLATDVYLTSIEVSEVGDSWSEWSTALSNGAEYSAIASIPTKHLKCH